MYPPLGSPPLGNGDLWDGPARAGPVQGCRAQPLGGLVPRRGDLDVRCYGPVLDKAAEHLDHARLGWTASPEQLIDQPRVPGTASAIGQMTPPRVRDLIVPG